MYIDILYLLIFGYRLQSDARLLCKLLPTMINQFLNNSVNYYHNIINIMINLREFVFIRENSYSHMYYFMYRNNVTIKETKV